MNFYAKNKDITSLKNDYFEFSRRNHTFTKWVAIWYFEYLFEFSRQRSYFEHNWNKKLIFPQKTVSIFARKMAKTVIFARDIFF